MKKTIYMLVMLAFLISLLPAKVVSAASLPTCSIPTWQVIYNGAWISGGCTCHVAERVKKETGKLVPRWSHAYKWWTNSTWPKNAETPRVGAIATFYFGSNKGHVAYVESITLKSNSSPVKIRTAYYTKNWIKYSATLYKVTQTYTVKLSHKDYSRILKGDNTVRYNTFESKQVVYYWKTVNLRKLDSVSWRPFPTTPANKWTTPRVGNAKGLQGYIYP